MRRPNAQNTWICLHCKPKRRGKKVGDSWLCPTNNPRFFCHRLRVAKLLECLLNANIVPIGHSGFPCLDSFRDQPPKWYKSFCFHEGQSPNHLSVLKFLVLFSFEFWYSKKSAKISWNCHVISAIPPTTKAISQAFLAIWFLTFQFYTSQNFRSQNFRISIWFVFCKVILYFESK